MRCPFDDGAESQRCANFVDWLCVSVCVCMSVSVCGVCINPYTQFTLSPSLKSFLPPPPPPPPPTVHAGRTSIFDDSKDTTVTPTSLEHFLPSLQYSLQELFANRLVFIIQYMELFLLCKLCDVLVIKRCYVHESSQFRLSGEKQYYYNFSYVPLP